MSPAASSTSIRPPHARTPPTICAADSCSHSNRDNMMSESRWKPRPRLPVVAPVSLVWRLFNGKMLNCQAAHPEQSGVLIKSISRRCLRTSGYLLWDVVFFITFSNVCNYLTFCCSFCDRSRFILKFKPKDHRGKMEKLLSATKKNQDDDTIHNKLKNSSCSASVD